MCYLNCMNECKSMFLFVLTCNLLFQQYFSYFVVVSFYWWRTLSARRKTQIPRHDWNSDSQLYCKGSCKSNCHTVMTTMAPVLIKAIADIYSFDDKQQFISLLIRELYFFYSYSLS